MSNVQINPAWQSYKNVQLEGGEGFNPHPKWIARQVVAAVAVSPALANRLVVDERGNTVPAAKMAARLAKDEATMLRITDTSARSIVQASIAFARAQLA